MKKIIIAIFFVTLLFTSTPQPANAIYCSNCSTWMNDIKDAVVQAGQWATEKLTTANTYLTSVNSTWQKINETVLKPARDYLTMAAIATSGDNIKNLVLGGAGNDKLLLSDPEAYIKKKANDTISINLGTIAGAKGAYSNSILNSVLSSTRQANDTAGYLTSLTQSPIPSIVQKNLCNDTALQQKAIAAVISENGQLIMSKVPAKKAELFGKLCTGNPSSDPKLASVLNNINKQDPSIGGWDTWLATTGGNNPYTSTIKTQEELARQAQAKIASVTRDITVGGGIKSQMTCVKTASGDLNNEASVGSSLPCLQESIQKTSASIKGLWDETLASPVKTLQSSITGATSLVGTAFNTFNLLKDINNSFETVSNNLGGDSGQAGKTSGYAYSVPTSYSATGPYSGGVNYSKQTTSEGNLITNIFPNGIPAPQETSLTSLIDQDTSFDKNILTSMLDAVKSEIAEINNLKSVDENYISTINGYIANLDSVNSCYAGILKDFSKPANETNKPFSFGNNGVQLMYATDPVNPNFITFYNNKKNTSSSLKDEISLELNKIPESLNLANQTISTLNAAKSTLGITSAFSDYQNKISSGKLPDSTAKANRTINYENYKEVLTQNNQEVQSYMNQCTELRKTYEENRRAAEQSNN